MSNIEFESDHTNYSTQQPLAQKGGMTNWLIRHGIMKSDGGAKGLLVAIIIVDIIAAIVILKYFVL
jgi:hypothetical protein